MGFGLLLIGYVFAFTAAVGLGDYIFAGMLIGGSIMYLGLSELKKYSPVFIYAFILDIFLILCAFFKAMVWVDVQLALGLGIDSPMLLTIFDWVEFAINLLFNIAMLYGIADISRRVDYPETKGRSYRNMIFVVLFNVYQLFMAMPIKAIEEDKSFFMTLLVILQLIYSVLNTFLIFKCYAMICPQGQEDMPRKPSRFAFINKFHEKLDQREQEAYENAKSYLENNKKNNNTKKKKKKK